MVDKNEILKNLYDSLDERWRSEEVAREILKVIDLKGNDRKLLESVAANSYWRTSMNRDFQRANDMSRQLNVAQALGMGQRVTFPPDDIVHIEQWLENINQELGKKLGENDFKDDRLTRDQRHELGIKLSRRQYNKQFRMAVRLEKKIARMKRNQFKRALALASKNRLASEISWDEFSQDLNTACLIAYYVARCNRRSIFTNSRQERAFDQVCDFLMKHCNKYRDATNWWALAHVMPDRGVVKRLTDEQKGHLLGKYFGMMQETANFLKELFDENDIDETSMIVSRGNDSTTWNIAAGAWNKLRSGWFSLMYSMGLVKSVEEMCPGKVLRLMAADVVGWHCGDLHRDTAVWRDLPRPWEVFSGEKTCTIQDVVDICEMHGIDPVNSGWSAPPPGRFVERTTPTPELVHGVAVSSPVLADIFRKAGVFSGKGYKGGVSVVSVELEREKHILEQENR